MLVGLRRTKFFFEVVFRVCEITELLVYEAQKNKPPPLMVGLLKGPLLDKHVDTPLSAKKPGDAAQMSPGTPTELQQAASNDTTDRLSRPFLEASAAPCSPLSRP